MRRRFVTAVIVALTAHAAAFNGHIATEGPIRIEIAPVGPPVAYDTPYDVKVAATNAADARITVRLELGGLVDEWHPVGPTTQTISVGPHQTTDSIFRIAADPGAYSALYPAHVTARFEHAGRTHDIHAVQVFECRFPPRPPIVPDTNTPVVVPVQGVTPLAALKNYRVGWQYFGQPLVMMPPGWSGSAQPSRASFAVHPVDRGGTRRAIDMHPAWYGGAGTVFVEYRLRLPNTRPLIMSSANAIRDHTAAEPPSDGVTFRVWIDDIKAFEHHTDSKTWKPVRVDLSPFAGRTIRLRLESHPGPKNDTTCDGSYWADPVIVAGNVLSNEQLRADHDRRRRDALAGRGHRLDLADGYHALVVPGPGGLTDAVIALRGPNNRTMVLDGMAVSILGRRVGTGAVPLPVQQVHAEPRPGGSLRIIHRLIDESGPFELTADLTPHGPGLRIAVRCPRRITDFAAGPADQQARRVYYGHGYVIERPHAFRAGYGGHNLSASHVGFDFENGLSLLMAVDNPPDYLQVDPASRTYALHTHMNATLTLVPGTAGAFDAALRFRTIDTRRPSPGFTKKAGRFVFDIWGGAYADNARHIQRLIDYGLTDSLLTLHVWQRWGYDYRLPDIYPPNPDLGTLADLQRLGDICRAAGIPWGLHDNYIDFYPDAADYSYDHICFTEAGQPVKAWLNTGRDAQSYRWRPDHIMPFVRRNLQQIGPNLRPTHYFIDVFTSIDMFDYYDRHGRFHSFLETREHWGRAFRWIQDILGGAITTSEAGDDQLVGSLDGADCQHLNISPEPQQFNLHIRCADWQRTPWYDAVLHDKFSLHGVGYSGRYEGGRGRIEHGILSDDYISDEILLGHALMIDRPGLDRGAVRKYWLAQDFIRSIATDTIAAVHFVDDDIHRQVVRWSGGAVVYVNRGSADWTVAGKTLPSYGYLAINGPIQSSIERLDGCIVEQSRNANTHYVNARGYAPEDRLPISPAVKTVEYLGGRRFRMPLQWIARQPAPGDLTVFVHFKSDRSKRYDRIAFQADHQPKPPTGRWHGTVVTAADRIIEIPPEFGPGTYDIHVGLYDPASGRRALLGHERGSRSYDVGKLRVDGNGDTITNIRLTDMPTDPLPEPRWNVDRTPVAFDRIRTSGALRLESAPDHDRLIPLPDCPPFTVELRVPAGRRVRSVTAVDPARNARATIDSTTRDGWLRFTTRPDDFAYRITYKTN